MERFQRHIFLVPRSHRLTETGDSDPGISFSGCWGGDWKLGLVSKFLNKKTELSCTKYLKISFRKTVLVPFAIKVFGKFLGNLQTVRGFQFSNAVPTSEDSCQPSYVSMPGNVFFLNKIIVFSYWGTMVPTNLWSFSLCKVSDQAFSVKMVCLWRTETEVGP